MVRRFAWLVVVSGTLAACPGCLALSLGGKHEVITTTDVETQNRLSSLEARVHSLEQRLEPSSGPAMVPVP